MLKIINNLHLNNISEVHLKPFNKFIGFTSNVNNNNLF